MSMGNEDASTIIRGLKSHFGVRSDDALSERIGVAKSTIATWRRRNAIPGKVMEQLESDHGLSADTIVNARNTELRDYVLRQCLYYITITMSNEVISKDGFESSAAALADDFATLDPYLTRTLVKAASVDRFRGASGAMRFLRGLQAGEVDIIALVEEATADRRRDLDV